MTPNQSALTEMEQSRVSTVFRGTVVERKLLPTRTGMGNRGRYAITFRVEESWKGPPPQTLTIYGVDRLADCLRGGEYEAGKEYLVYATEEIVRDVMLGGRFWYSWTDILPEGAKVLMPAPCTFSGEPSRMQESLRVLGKGLRPAPRP